MRLTIFFVAVTGLALCWSFWWAHLFTWMPGFAVYGLMLRKLQADSPLYVLSRLLHSRILGMSDPAIRWLNKNAHALIMWGAAKAMSNDIKRLLVVASLSLVLTAFSHSWWWLLEFLLVSATLFPVFEGFLPLNRWKMEAIEASGRDAFLKTEIFPLFAEIVREDLQSLSGYFNAPSRDKEV